MPIKDRALHLLPILAAAVPLLILFRLATIALYAAPESDDFCLANHFNSDGLIGTLEVYYKTLMGRLIPLALITLPAAIGKALNLDYFVVYPLVLIFGMAIFIASTTLAVGRLWSGLSTPERVLIGTALSATIAVLAISLREMFYWISGSVPYMVPAVLIMVIVTELVRSATNETDLSHAQVSLLSALCFLGALCNEFTPLWIIAFIAGSFLFRRASSHPHPQASGHAIMLTATLTGFAILLLAPGNAVRMGYYSAGQKLAESFVMAAYYLWLDLGWLYDERAAWAWLLFLAVFSAFIAPVQPKPLKRPLLLAAGLVVLTLVCAYTAYFVAYFATSEDLATRARNQVIVLLMIGLSCAVAIAVRIIQSGRTQNKRNGLVRTAALVACGMIGALLFSGRSLVAVNAERSQFDTFWIESMKRHALLRTTPQTDVVVPDRSTKPTVLMAADLTADPSRIPNDCVAVFYGKKSVILRAGVTD